MADAEPLAAYEALVAAGEIRSDPIQAEAMRRLQALSDDLVDYAEQMGRTGWRARLGFGGAKRPKPKGLYFWGGVGHGKTMLMDLFFAHTPVDAEAKKHVHFHAFMQEVHNACMPSAKRRRRARCRKAATPWRRFPRSSSTAPGCCASTSSTSPTSPTR